MGWAGVDKIKQYRKTGSDRRSGTDRRQSPLPRQHDTERRTGAERRFSKDRRFRFLSFAKQPKPAAALLGFFLRKPWKKSPETKSRSKDGSTVYLQDPQKRAQTRLTCEAPVQLHDRDTSEAYPATACNYSRAGMYLESDYAPRIGAGLLLEMLDHKIGSPAPEDIAKYPSCVVWRAKLSGNLVFTRYGMGVKHCQDLDEFLRLFSF